MFLMGPISCRSYSRSLAVLYYEYVKYSQSGFTQTPETPYLLPSLVSVRFPA